MLYVSDVFTYIHYLNELFRTLRKKEQKKNLVVTLNLYNLCGKHSECYKGKCRKRDSKTISPSMKVHYEIAGVLLSFRSLINMFYATPPNQSEYQDLTLPLSH